MSYKTLRASYLATELWFHIILIYSSGVIISYMLAKLLADIFVVIRNKMNVKQPKRGLCTVATSQAFLVNESWYLTSLNSFEYIDLHKQVFFFFFFYHWFYRNRVKLKKNICIHFFYLWHMSHWHF